MTRGICGAIAVIVLLASLGSLQAADSVLVSASEPGAYAVRFWPDRAMLNCASDKPVQVSIPLPAPARWALLDGTSLSATEIIWDRQTKCATIHCPAGRHTAVVGWAGRYQKPAQGQRIPVLLDGKQIGELTCSFDLEKLIAQGTITCPTAITRVRLEAADPTLHPSLTVGSQLLDRWRLQGRTLVARQRAMVSATTTLTLQVPAYNLLRAPLQAVSLQTLQQGLTPTRHTAMPERGLVIEAENYTAEGLGKAEISTKHFGTHGGKSIYNNSGEGHWLEYVFAVPQAGTYDLYVRMALDEVADTRSIAIDGKTPQGLGLVEFTGTGGWGYSSNEWAALQLTGLPQAPSLKLEAGQHRLRITGIGETHLNLDYFVLLPR